MTQQERGPRELRSDIIDRSDLGPVIIISSQADGWTSNASSLKVLFEDHVVKENNKMFVLMNDKNIEFTAMEYMAALHIYTEALENPRELDHIVEYVNAQMVAAGAKRQYVKLEADNKNIQ